MVNIVLFGAPGCGKGTQAQRLKEHYGIDHVSTGEVIRDEIRRGTELGQSMEAYIKAGQLAPDEIVIGMIDHYVTGHKNAAGCIFDGFPRTTVQAEEFDKILGGHGLGVTRPAHPAPRQGFGTRRRRFGRGDSRASGCLPRADGRRGGLLRRTG